MTLPLAEVPPEVLVENPLWLGYRGSIAHGTHVPSADPDSIDDVDLIGVFVAPRDHYVGLNQVKETVERKKDEWDVVHYEVRHFLRLLLKSNPNVLSTLWLPDHHVVHADPLWSLVVENRAAFASKQAYPAFTGYAYAQLKKMTRLQEPDEKRDRQITDLNEEIAYRERRTPSDPNHYYEEYRNLSMQKLREKLNGLRGQSGYMGEKRRALVDAYGYDAKNASHLIRLLRQGIEFLETGEMKVERDDADELLAIKRGEWGLYAVQQLATTLFSRAKDAVAQSSLPENPDREVANRVCQGIVEEFERTGT